MKIKKSIVAIGSAILFASSSVSASLEVKQSQLEAEYQQREIQAMGILEDGRSIKEGETLQLRTMVLYTNGEADLLTHEVEWLNVTPELMSIANNGVAFGVQQGTGLVRAEWKGHQTDFASIFIGEAPDAIVESVSIDIQETELSPGTSTTVGATAKFDDGSSRDVTETVTWHLNNASATGVLKIEGDVLTALKAGEVRVRASLEGVTSNDVSVVVDDVHYDDVGAFPITFTPLNKKVGEIVEVTVEAIDHNGERHRLEAGQYTFKIDNPLVLEATAEGDLQVIGKGSASAYVEAGNVTTLMPILINGQ